ncbi:MULTISPECIES: ATP-binding cassette domain-containing protein [Oceanimonas]|uniref:ATP-binding cassette domain-containing protein n=1 Tax=Oceanimonas smirnovii TaxID=264574 RepID=A0ABW7P442_9GAMM|nr:ATP-binding cassette domain-containing protein [Oceanimonas sp. CAM02]MDV2858528.1 ATP-binding cassette domain-containing protein [Oceanimonas sp. CAM02]
MAELLSIEQLSFAWPGQANLLNIDSLSLKPGDRLFIKGPSGSGKSTLLGLLAGILKPNSGRLRILGQDLARLSGPQRDRFRANHLGYIFQQFNLLPYLPVMENVTAALIFSPHKRKQLTASPKQEAARLLAALQLPDALWQQPVHRLSIGQQQRVAAARALIGRPALVIADEPTSALDADNRTAFMELLFAECEHAGSGLVFVSHDSALEPLFSHVTSLKQLNGANDAEPGL